MFYIVFEVKELFISQEPHVWWGLDQNVAFQMDKWFILKNQNWQLPTCDSFLLIVSHIMKKFQYFILEHSSFWDLHILFIKITVRQGATGHVVMWIQRGHIWHLGKFEFSVNLETSDKNTQRFSSNLKLRSQIWFLWKKNNKTKEFWTQNGISYKMKYKIEKDQNTNTTLLHSHDDITFRVTCVDVWLKFGNHLKRVL